jgi:hypothetical protein
MKVTAQFKKKKKKKKNRIVNGTNRGTVHRKEKEHAHLGIQTQARTRPMVSSKWKQAGKVKMTKEVLNDEGKWT